MAGVQPTKFINYISQFKKLLVTRNNGIIQQKFKIDSATDDNYYFSIVNSNNRLIDLTGRTFKIYGSIFDSKDTLRVLFYSDKCTIEQNGQQMHFKIDTYTSQYMNIVKTNKIIDLTIVEVVNPDDNIPDEEQITQVILRDTAIAYKRPYIENQTPAEILQKVILTTNVPLTGVFGSGQDINLTIGSNGAAFGTGLTQTGDNQLVIGQYNEADATKAFIIGNGENDTVRSNLFTIDYEGNIQTPGAISANAITVDGQDVGDKVNQLENTIEAVSAAIPSVEGFATEQWVQDQGYLTAHQDLTAYATKSWVEGKGYITGVNLDPYATKDQLTAYATKSDLTVSASVLNNQISQLALNIPTKVSDLTNDAGYLTAVPTSYALKTDIPTGNAQLQNTAGYITGYNAGTGISISNGTISLTGEVGKTYYADNNTLQLNNSTNTFSIKSLSSKLNQGQNILLTPQSDGSVTINALGGGGGGTGGATYLAGLGLSLSTVSAEDGIYKFYVNEPWLDNKIDTATSGIQNLSAGTGLEIEDNVISLTAQIPSIDGLASEQWVEANFLSAIPSNYATKDYVDSSVSGKADLSSVYTKEEVYTYIETDAKINQATSGKADKSELTGLATKDEVQAVDDKFDNYYTSAQVDQAIAAAVEDIPSTVYTGEDGIKVEDGVISLTATIPTAISDLTNDSQFATSAQVSSIVEGYNYLSSISVEYNNSTGSITGITLTDSFINGTIQNNKLELDWAGIKCTQGGGSEYFTEIDSDTLEFDSDSQHLHINIPNSYTEEVSGAAVEAVTGWVDDQNYLTEIPTSYVQQSELESVSGQLTNAIGAKANTTDVEAEFTATSAWANETFLTEHQSLSSYYTKSEVDSAIGTATNDMATQSWVEEQGYLTAHQSLDDYYNKTEVNSISSNIVSQIPTDVATSAYVQAASGNAVSVATGWVEGKNYLTEVPSEYITETELATELEPYAQTSDVTTAITNATSGKADQSTVESLSTTLSTAIDTKANSADVYTKSQVYTKGETDSAITTATSGKVNKTDFDTVTGALSTAIDTKVTSAQVSSIVTGYNYITGITVSYNDEEWNSYTVSGTGIDFGQGFVEVSDWGDNIAHVQWKGLRIWDESTDETLRVKQIDFSSTDFNIRFSEDYIYVSLANPILSTSQLTNDSGFATSSYVQTVSSNIVSQIPTNYTTSAQVSAIVTGFNYITGITVTCDDENWDQYTVSGTSLKFSDPAWWSASASDNIIQITWNGIRHTGGSQGIGDNSIISPDIQWSDEFNIVSDQGCACVSLANPILSTSQLINDSEFATSAYVTGQVNNLATGAVATNTANIGQLSTDLGTVSGKANANETAIGTLSTRIGTAEGNISTLSTDLGTAQNNITQLSTSVNTISTTYATTNYVNTVSTNLSTELTGWVADQNYTSGYTAGSGLEITENNVIQLTVSVIPSAVSQLVNDSNFITYADIVDGVEYHAGEGLSLINNTFALTGTVLSGDGSTIAINNNVISVIGGGSGGKTYTGGTGIEVDNTNDTISLTATIPTKTSDLTNDSGFITAIPTTYVQKSEISDMATQTWVSQQGYLTDIPTSYALKTDVETAISSSSGAIVDVATGAITVPTKTSDLTNDSGFATSAQVSSIVTGFNYLSSITVSYYDQNESEYVQVSAAGLKFPTDFNILIDSDDHFAWIEWNGFYTQGGGLEQGFNAKNIQWMSDFDVWQSDGGIGVALANPIPLSTSQLTNDSGYQTAAQVSAIASAYAGGGGGGGTTYTAGTGIDITSDVISVDQTWFENSVSSLVSGEIDSAASAAVESYIELSGLATGTGLYYDDTDNSLNINLSADANSNMVVSADNNGVVWLSAVNIPSTVYNLLSAGDNIQLTKNEQTGVTTISASNSGGGSSLSSVYDLLSAGPNIALSKDDSTGITTISGSEGGSSITNKQAKLTLTGAVVEYSPDYEIFETTGNSVVDGVITIQPVANINLAAGEVATFEHWINPSATVTGFTFDSSYKFIGELPSQFTANSIQVFKVRVYNSPAGLKQFISYAYQFDNPFYTPLTFVGKANSNSIKFAPQNSPSAIVLNYSKNGGEWQTYNIGDTITLNLNQTVAFSGANENMGNNYTSYRRFIMEGKIQAFGNINSLINYNKNITSCDFQYIFSGATSLVSIQNLYLPATTLAMYCYRNMFQNCNNLSTVPANLLPATTLAYGCYADMFAVCTKLSNAPSLPVTSLTDYCYNNMFYYCFNLSKAPQLPATTLASYCYGSMFTNCSSLTSIVLPATTLVNSCCMEMFRGCENLSNIEVAFTSWTSNGTRDWAYQIAANGTFICPEALGTNQTITRGNSNCPTNWTVVNK